jgi:non-ribosomal peptide synthetase component F
MVDDLEDFEGEDDSSEDDSDVAGPSDSVPAEHAFQALLADDEDGGGEEAGATAKFEMLISLARLSTGPLAGTLEYSTDLFDHQTVDAICSRFSYTLQQMTEAPSSLLFCEFSMMDAQAARMVLDEWNETALPYAEEMTVHELFEATAQATLRAVAVVFEGVQVTYEQMLLCTGRVVRQLQSCGVGADGVVGLVWRRASRRWQAW